MIVIDASVLVDLLLDLPPHADEIAERLLGVEREGLAAPHLLDAEVGQVLRRFVRAGDLAAARAQVALEDLADFPITRFVHTPFLARAFELRDNATVYDALYLALAEVLDAPLWTRDRALARIPGHAAAVEVFGR